MEKDRIISESGFEIDRAYGPKDEKGNVSGTIGEAGTFPFTRHIYQDGYRSRIWQPSLYSGFGTPEDANSRFRYLLDQGNGRVNVAFDLPTQLGLDCDDSGVVRDVGRVGVSVCSLADFEIMFQGIPLAKIPVSLNISSMAPIIQAMLVAVAKKQDCPLDQLRGTIANDICHEFISRGAWIFPVEGSLRLLGDTAEYIIRNMPKFYPFNVRAILLHEQGAAPPQEVGISFGIARTYIDLLLDRGFTVDDVASRLSFFFGTGMHFFEEAAKFRAARRLWARIVREEYGSVEETSQKLRFTCVAGCGSYFSAQLPELNLVRSTLGALGAALGGTQAMLGTTIDEAYDIPTEYSQLLALRTQQILALESDVASTVDPLGGSYFVESMTDQIEEMSQENMNEVYPTNGVIEGINNGSIQRKIERRAYRIQCAIEDGTRPWVGVNVHTDKGQDQPEIVKWEHDEELWKRRVEALEGTREQRDEGEVRRALERLEEECRSQESVMPATIKAVEAYSTVGEICEVYRTVFGEFQEPVPK
ncbi:MAG TPA: methylmalonyl-CoA mutase [Candidatus Thalassarchaeaceae archaeon]|nr:methylmalonyl-CoA mutase [Candidatus Thalassarchaeaceae archaeon]